MNKRTKENIVGLSVCLIVTLFIFVMYMIAPMLRGEV